MRILVFNAGSSSLKFGVFDMSTADSRVFKGEFEHFKDGGCTLHYRIGGEAGKDQQREEAAATISDAIRRVPALLKEFGYEAFEAVGHRVAHGGERFRDAALLTPDVIREIEACTPLAPLHNPANLEAIAVSRQLWPALPQAAVFDTAFHHTMPDRAHTYAVPKAWREAGLRRYGFHGTSHKYVALRAAEALKRPVTELKIISCHLGNGASLCAISRGFSVDTSMGMTPLEGLVMGSRSGDVDPGIFTYLARTLNLPPEEVERQLYAESGLKALGGTPDMREVEEKAAAGDSGAQLALSVYAYRARKYIGAYAAAMGGADALVFTGGIGENSASMRRRICDRMEFLGLFIDENRNQGVRLKSFEAPEISTEDSRIHVLVTQTNEQFMIAEETRHLLTRRVPVAEGRIRIPVAVSARHVHLSQTDVEKLFGAGHQLKKEKTLKQPEGWAAEETVEVIGPRGSFRHVRVLGPTRAQTQIEVSKTDTFTLGLDAPVRLSGQLENTPRVRLRGPAGEIETNGLIVAARHIHTNPTDAERWNLKDGDFVDVKLGADGRETTFANTRIRIKPDYVTEMHIDTDEANAAGIAARTEGKLVLNDHGEHATITAHRNMRL